MAALVTLGLDLDCVLSVISTIHMPLLFRHPWRAGGAVEDMATSLALKTFTPSCPGKKTVVYPLCKHRNTHQCWLTHARDHDRLPGTLEECMGRQEPGVRCLELRAAGGDDNFVGTTGKM